MGDVKADRTASVAARLRDHQRRLSAWRKTSKALIGDLSAERTRARRAQEVDDITAGTEALIESLETAGGPLVRVVAVIASGS